MAMEKKWFPQWIANRAFPVLGGDESSALLWSYEEPESDNGTV